MTQTDTRKSSGPRYGACYEAPLTLEEISLATGLPTMYIEDALSHLVYGDAIEQIKQPPPTHRAPPEGWRNEREFQLLIGAVADYFEALFANARKINGLTGTISAFSGLAYRIAPFCGEK